MSTVTVDRLLDELEESYEWRADAPAIVRDLLAQLPVTPVTSTQRARLTLLQTDRLVRDQGSAAAAKLVVELREQAVVEGDRGVEVGAETALSVLFRRIGDPTRALEHAVRARALDGSHLRPAVRCRVALALADGLDECGSYADARPRYEEALEHARGLDTPWLSLKVMNNWAYAALSSEELALALALTEQMRTTVAEHGVALRTVNADTVAEILHAAGRSSEAVALLRQHLREEPDPTPIVRAYAWLVLARIERETGELDAADVSLGVAERLTADQEWHAVRVEALGERAELLAAGGDPAGALALYRRFHVETLELRSEASEARAQTLHAMLEVDEARRESARYREMSYRDALTGLFNRRFVDEDLDRRLSRSGAEASPLAVALVDLDHFKRVNDTLSHAAGDAVLVRLAALLTDATRTLPDAYAARLGGEEFLLVLPCADLPGAYRLAEDVRSRIARHDWSPISPGVSITASFGLAESAAPEPVERADLLREADRHLYAAKNAGRNRVEPTPG